jgi:hypothetical protein
VALLTAEWHNREIMRRLAVWVVCVSPLLAQPPAAIPPDLRFEVASLKPSAPGGRGSFIRPAQGGARYEATNCTIKAMIQPGVVERFSQLVICRFRETPFLHQIDDLGQADWR